MWNQAACHGETTNMFFPEPATPAAVERAKTCCRSCPILHPCAQWAVDSKQRYGIWGATTPEERAAVRAGTATLEDVQTPPHPAPPRHTSYSRTDRHPCRGQAVRYAAALGYTLEQLQRPDRHRAVTDARQQVAWNLLREDGFSSTAVGEVLCRDHSTILAAAARIEAAAAS